MTEQAFLPSDVVFAFSRRSCGNMSLTYGDTTHTLKNREVFLSGLGIDYRGLVCAEQVHGSRAEYVTAKDSGKGAFSGEGALAKTDALITEERNLPLAVFTADCLSIFILDRKRPAIGLIHAGWRGAKENIITKTIELMRKMFNSRPENLYAVFGPAIRSCCYEVGDEFRDFFPAELIERNGRFYLDLAQLAKKQILQSGIKEANIRDPRLCTFCARSDFFSFRREGNASGRIISVAMLK